MLLIKKFTGLTVAAVTLALAPPGQAQYSITPFTSFGGDGLLANGEIAYLANDNLQRGLAYGNGELYLVSRTGGNNVRRLNPITGADLGGLNMTGVTGGSGAAINAVAVADDGVIYAGNLTIGSSTSPYKIYKWATVASAPVVAYSGDPFGGAARYGDNLAAIGSGASTRLAAGSGATAVTGDNGFALVDPTAGTATHFSVAGTADGAFRLGIDFISPTALIGTQGGPVQNASITGSLLGTTAFSTGTQRALGYTLLGGVGLIAAVDTIDGRVRVYDATNPLSLGSPVLFGSVVSHIANANATGAVAWGDAYYDTNDGKWKAEVYVLETNNGIQAYTIAVPEPATGALLGLGLSALIALRRSRK